MRKFLIITVITLFAVAFIAPIAFAADATAAAPAEPSAAKLQFYGMVLLGALIGIGLAAAGCGAGMGTSIRGVLEGTARNPGLSGKLMTTLIIGLALIESQLIYALVIILISFYANPFVK
jgi:F-type H+-transporting ATPase subunit c